MDAETDVDVRDIFMADTKLQEGRVFVFDALAEVEVKFLDARKVVDVRGRVRRVMVDGKGVAVCGKARAADDVAANGGAGEMDGVAVAGRRTAARDVAGDGSAFADVDLVAFGDDAGPAEDASGDGDAVGDVDDVAQRCVMGTAAVDVAGDVCVDVHDVFAAGGASADDLGRCVRGGCGGDGDGVLLGIAGCFRTHDLGSADAAARDLNAVLHCLAGALCALECARDAARGDDGAVFGGITDEGFCAVGVHCAAAAHFSAVLFGSPVGALCADEFSGDTAAREDGFVLEGLAVLCLGSEGVHGRSGFDLEGVLLCRTVCGLCVAADGIGDARTCFEGECVGLGLTCRAVHGLAAEDVGVCTAVDFDVRVLPLVRREVKAAA